MIQFYDKQGFLVEYSQHATFGEAGHVLVICSFRNQWVLTRNRIRGLEFPGGKREMGETIEEAAIREVYEETGGVVCDLKFWGQYKVHSSKPFVKSIYYTELTEMKIKKDYLETDGPVLLDILPADIKHNPDFSYIMKDEILSISLKRIKQIKNPVSTYGDFQKNE